MSDTITIPVTFEDIRERKPAMFSVGDKVSLKGLTYSGVIIGIGIYGWYVIQSEDGRVYYNSTENLTKVEEKGVSEFKVGDVVKFNNNGLFYKIVYLGKEYIVTNKLNDEANKISSKQETGFAVNSPLYLSMELATDEWVAHQEQQKDKEESKAVAAILKELASQIENGELHVFVRSIDYARNLIAGGTAVSLKLEGTYK